MHLDKIKKRDSGYKYVSREEGDDIPLASTLLTSTIAGLNETDNLNDNALFEVSVQPLGDGKYLSKSVSWMTVLRKIQEMMMGYFDTRYKTTRHNAIGEYLVGKMVGVDVDLETSTVNSFLKLVSYSDIENVVWDFVSESPAVWNDVFALAIEDLRLSSEIEDLKEDVLSLLNDKIAFSSKMEFQTTISTFQTETGGTRSSAYVPKSLSEGYERGEAGLHNGFVIAFFKNNMVSTSYKCPFSGILVLYGWLDTTNVADLAYLPTGWCALEGFINGKWEMLQVQQVLPNKQFSYVAFTVPVLKDLLVRARLGFPPGEASGRYGMANVVNSLGNHNANAFLGGVYKTSPVVENYDDRPQGAVAGVAARQVVFNNVIKNITEVADLSKYVTKESFNDLVPKDFYSRGNSYTREQVNKAFGFHVEKRDVLPEVSLCDKNGAKFGDDDRPVNRVAVWNFSHKGEEPIGTVISNICKPDKNGFLPGRNEWKHCDGSTLPASDYQELASMLGVSSDGKIELPDMKGEKIPHYVKVKSSYAECEVAGWSRETLKKRGIATSVSSADWKSDPMINSIYDVESKEYRKL